MNDSTSNGLFQEIDQWTLIDPHSHINPYSPASSTLADLLGYHYYTELAHSAGMPRQQIEEPGLDPKEKVGRLMEHLGAISNTVQWSWMIELCQKLFGFEGDSIDLSNWETVYNLALSKMKQADWSEQVLAQSRIQSIFLTNDFDDSLQGFDRSVYIPCLRTDDLVFHLARPSVRERLEKCTQSNVTNLSELRLAIGKLFQHFVANNARACAISLPPYFAPQMISQGSAERALANLLSAGDATTSEDRLTLGYWMFWTLAEFCRDYSLPFDLMIGVNRQVYPSGVYQGQDLYDSRVSMIQYAPLFNAFPTVQFPISVLASVTNQELVDYAWIFPNVITNGHWWYSNTPSFIARDLKARLEAIPRTKQIAYYSDAYKLEFCLPKFGMYKRVLAQVLQEDFVVARGWTEHQAIDLARDILCRNVEKIFGGK